MTADSPGWGDLRGKDRGAATAKGKVGDLRGKLGARQGKSWGDLRRNICIWVRRHHGELSVWERIMLFPDKETKSFWRPEPETNFHCPLKGGTSETGSRRERRMSNIRPQTSVVPEVQGLALWPDSSNNSCTRLTGTSDLCGSDTSLCLCAALGQCGSHGVLLSSLLLTDSESWESVSSLRPYSLTILELRFLPAGTKSCPCVLQKDWAKLFYYKGVIISSLFVWVSCGKCIRFYYLKKTHRIPDWCVFSQTEIFL